MVTFNSKIHDTLSVSIELKLKSFKLKITDNKTSKRTDRRNENKQCFESFVFLGMHVYLTWFSLISE